MGLMDDWTKTEIGQRINMVCQSVLLDCNGKHLVRILGTSDLVVLYGDLEPISQMWTLLQVQVVEGRYKKALQLDGSSFVHPHEPTVVSSLTNCVELCCGAGFMSVGMKACGYDIVAGVEQNSHFGHLYHENDLGKFVHGSVSDADAIMQVLKAGGQNATVAAGVACQPYSRAGDGRSGADARASTLPHSLEFAWLWQAPVIILECTPQALKDEYVQNTLKTFCNRAGYNISQNLLHLEKCWAAHRARWWCVLSAKIIGEIKFGEMPIMPEYQRVEAIMPFVKEWPPSHLDQLTLSLYEHSKFHHYSKGIQTMILDTKKQMPTALHAWGNQCYPCACGCRPGFSEHRMQQRGLFSVLIAGEQQIEREGCKYPVCRHMHPAEVALLCGAFPNIDWKEQLRLGLAATGQMASPLQSCWVGSHVLQALAGLIQSECVAPDLKLHSLQKHILAIRDSIWIPRAAPVTIAEQLNGPEVATVFVESYPSCSVQEIKFRPEQTVKQLCKAEMAITLCQDETIWVSDQEGIPISPEDKLVPGMTYVLGYGCKTDEDDHSKMDFQEVVDLPLDFAGASNKEELSKVIPQTIMQDQTLPCHAIAPVGSKQAQNIVPPDSKGYDLLCKLGLGSLLQMIPPQVLTDAAAQELVMQTLPVEDRRAILTAQGYAWADDEPRFHLQCLAARAPKEQNVQVWDPVITTSSCKYRHAPCVDFQQIQEQKVVTIVTAICVQSHWVPVMWRKEQATLLGFSANANDAHRKAIQALHVLVCQELGIPENNMQFRDLGSIGDSKCGAIAIEFLEHLTWGTPLVLNEEPLTAKHSVYRQLFDEALSLLAHRPWIWGLGIDRDTQLIAILREHGVAADEVASRIDMLSSKLGSDKIAKAMQSHNPWRELKWIANQSVPPVQIVKPSELQSAIDARSSQQASLGRKKQKSNGKGKGKGKTRENQKTVDPSSLRLEDGIFIFDEATPLSQIQLQSIGPTAQGVALVTFDEALPFVSGGKAVTEGALALVVVDMPSVVPQLPLISAKVVFPAICAANSEPILIEGHLFQLGGKPVSKATGGSIVKLTTIDTCVAKCVVFRDQIQGDWNESGQCIDTMSKSNM